MFRNDERCSSTYTDCNEKLFEYLSSSYQLKTAWPFSSDLYDQQGIFAQTTDTGLKNRKYKIFTVFHSFFCFLDHSLETLKMILCKKNPSKSAVFATLRPAGLALTTMPHSFSPKSPFFHILMLVWTSAAHLVCVYVSKCIDCCHMIAWLNI